MWKQGLFEFQFSFIKLERSWKQREICTEWLNIGKKMFLKLDWVSLVDSPTQLLHLDIYLLCRYKNLKDIAGQSARISCANFLSIPFYDDDDILRF